MNAIFIGNAILLDYDVIEIEEINFSGLVKNTVNTWQANRSVNEKKADTELGKFAEDAVITALKILGFNCYHSYDSFRNDDFRLHAPFDGLIIKELNDELVNMINNAVVNEGPKLSIKTREEIRRHKGLTVEVKSTRLAQKYKNRASFNDYSNNEQLVRLIEELNSLDFLTYPHFTRYGDMTFEQYCWFVETRLRSGKRGQDLREFVKKIELDNSSDFYIRVFVDEDNKKVIILGCIDRYSFFENPRTHKLILPGKSEVPLYFVKSIKNGYPLSYLIEYLNNNY
jgi:hypothetical protein